MFVISFIFFLIISIFDILFWVNLWQLKEYRFDRLWVHIRDTQQGKNIFLSRKSLLIFLLFCFFVVGIFNDFLSKWFGLAVCIIFGILFMRIVLIFFAKNIKRPVFTFKAKGIVIFSFLAVVGISFFPLTDPSLWISILLLLIPLIVAFLVFLFAFPTEIYTDIYMQKAKEKRKKLKHLQVIAVSGSYGKSSTKEVIADVLSKKFNVVKTSLSNNTPLAIAKTIQAKLTAKTDFFIVELGAYKKGEIKQLAEMVGPTIGVTTAISDQHLALYGDMQDVILSELELLKVLPKSALILLNGNSKGVRKMFEKIKQKNVFWYEVDKNTKQNKNTVVGFAVQPNENGVEWKYRFKKHEIPFTSPLLGVHTVENILPAVFLGLHFGIREEDIQQAVGALQPMPKTMQKIASPFGTTFIDDTFNASPESVLSAISYLKLFSKRKILVLSPLIELGKASRKRHIEIGQELAGIDIVFLTNKNFLEELTQGVRNKNGKTKIITGSYFSLADAVRETLQKGDVVVFEGKEAGIVLHYL